MRLLVDLNQLGCVHMRVSLCRAQASVAEQLLNRAQVRAVRKQMGRKGMSQRVRADTELRAAQRNVPPHQSIDAAGRQAAAAIVEEERSLHATRTFRT